MKKFLILTIILISISSLLIAKKAYDVDYDDDNVIITVKNGSIIIKNNLKYPIVIDNIKRNDGIVKNYLKIANCNYIKYQNEVNVDYTGKDMQIFLLNLIIKPKEEKKIQIKMKKDDEIRVEYYVVNYKFISDNIYLQEKNISDTEKKYKLFPIEYIKKQNKLTGIMVYVTEYKMLIDNYEHPEITVE